ncbi:BQ2448_3233 [Microbotryum intermedium]|uniref:BQ2448_3233 protein n=1 Tax=Microbotryum intermedium TaxID=269621 RepID=A0A238FEM5_9BASI|nr:BQ2448_3233 [Microbotryum intermedium]
MTIYTSPFPPVSKWSDQGLFDFLFENNDRIQPDKVALVDAGTGTKLTYKQLISDSLKLGHGLSQRYKPGQTVLIFSPNSIIYPSLLFGTQAAAMVATTANSSYTPNELAHQINVSDADLLLVGSDLVDVAKKAVKEAGLKESQIFVLPGVDGKINLQGLESYEVLIGSGKGFKQLKISDIHAPAYLPFSSGTTGRGKGVAVSTFNITSVSLQLNQVKGLLDGPEIVMGVLPLYHIYGLIVLLHQTLLNGGTIVLLAKFDLPLFLESIQRYKATVALLVPPIALALAKHPIVDKFGLSSLRWIMSGAAPLSADLQTVLERRLKGKTLILQGYGMSETTSVGLLPDIRQKVIPGTVGRLLPSVEARLVDPQTGKDAKAGEPGELWLRGNNIMKGYHKNEKATAETINKDRWLLTGDVCIRSEDGVYKIVDRTKELIKYKGFQVPPAELEGLLFECPLVADAAVIGVWSEEDATEFPRAYIVPDAAHKDDKDLAKKVQTFVADRVAPHKKLRGGVFLLDVIPKSPSGKILRKDLRTLAAKEGEAKGKL